MSLKGTTVRRESLQVQVQRLSVMPPAARGSGDPPIVIRLAPADHGDWGTAEQGYGLRLAHKLDPPLGRLSATALLAPITWNLPFGLSVAEAMAGGTPVVATRRGSTADPGNMRPQEAKVASNW